MLVGLMLIDYVLDQEYKKDKDLETKTKLKTYLVYLINQYYIILDEFNKFNSKCFNR
jgi:hypothetical protein